MRPDTLLTSLGPLNVSKFAAGRHGRRRHEAPPGCFVDIE
jgi:hypothetical protein